MTEFEIKHGLSQDAPGPLEPVEFAQQPGAAPATGNTARDQEMYAAGIRTGEENAKHNAAIRAGVPDGWKLLEAMRESLLWTASSLAAVGKERDLITLEGRKRTIGEILDEANAALDASFPDCAAPGVSTVEDAQDERQAFEAQPYGWLYDWTHSSATGRPDEHYTGFTEDEQHAKKHDNPRAIYLAAPAAGDALEWTLISDRLPKIPDGAPGKRIHILVGRYYEGRWFSWSLWYGPRGQDLRFYEEFSDEDADGDDVEITKATHWRYMTAGPAIAQRKGDA